MMTASRMYFVVIPAVSVRFSDLFVLYGWHLVLLLGIEARGFIFGPAIALAIGAKFIPLRKPGKLPGNMISTLHFQIILISAVTRAIP